MNRLSGPPALELPNEYSSFPRRADFESPLHRFDLPSCREIPLWRPEGHFLARFLQKGTVLNASDLEQIADLIGPEIHATIIGKGSIPASDNPATHYSAHSWPRDAAMVAFALKRDGKSAEAREALWSLVEFYGGQSQRGLFDYFHFSPNPVEEYARQARHPHSMACIDPSGKLVESPQMWGHEQLDTIGWFLFLSFRLANEKTVKLEDLDARVTSEVNCFNADESIFPVVLKFLHRIEAWRQSGRGPWEDVLRPVRASEQGMLLAGLSEAVKFFRGNPKGWGAFPLSYGESVDSQTSINRFQHEVEELFSNVRRAVGSRVPNELGARALECDIEEHSHLHDDSSLVWLLYPGEISLEPLQELAVLRTVYANMREMGFVRMRGDSYVGQDYAHLDDAIRGDDFANSSVSSYREAQWSLFDPLLSAYFSRRFAASGGTDLDALARADRHLKRGLALMTTDPVSYDWARARQGDCVRVEVPARCLSEALWYSSRDQQWRPNHNSPLLMANAALALALLRYRFALQV